MSIAEQTEQIPFVDLPGQCQELMGEVIPAIADVIGRAAFILGPEVDQFEQEFARYCGSEFCVSVATGTDALHLALRAVGVGPGDEVITAGNSFAATAFAITHAGATPVFVDVNSCDHNIDVNLLEQAITPRTRAIVPVHLYGQPADVDPICEVASKHGIRVIEDACQAHGARYRNRPAGSLGDAGCFSFYPGKNLGAFGDGGAVVTGDPQIAENLRLLRNYGQHEKNVHSMLAFNSRLDTIQAAVLNIKLAHLDDWNDQRRQAARWYRSQLEDTSLELTADHDHSRHVYHLFVAKHEQRDAIIEELRQHKIFCGIHYPYPLILAEPYRNSRSVPEGLPVCTELAGRIFSLPMFPGITQRQINRICEVIKIWLQRHE